MRDAEDNFHLEAPSLPVYALTSLSTHHHHSHHLSSHLSHPSLSVLQTCSCDFQLRMDQITDVIYQHHRQSSSSDHRFLTVFSPPKVDSQGTCAVFLLPDDDLNEAELFWTGDFTESNRRPISPPDSPAAAGKMQHRHSFRKPEKFGILAALPEEDCHPNQPLLCRKPSISSPSAHSPSRMLLPTMTTTKPAREYSQSAPARKFMQSAPVTVPMMQKKARNTDLDEDGEDEILPPHEIVAKGLTKSSKTTFSVLEGAGRTLKGRDLRQVRNAVWRRTGFVD